MTIDPENDGSPVWSADSTRLAYAAQRSGKVFLRQELFKGTPPGDPLLESLNSIEPSDWSVNGFIAYTVITGRFPPKYDVWILPPSGGGTPFPFAQTKSSEASGTFSRDGRWIALCE